MSRLSCFSSIVFKISSATLTLTTGSILRANVCCFAGQNSTIRALQIARRPRTGGDLAPINTCSKASSFSSCLLGLRNFTTKTTICAQKQDVSTDCCLRDVVSFNKFPRLSHTLPMFWPCFRLSNGSQCIRAAVLSRFFQRLPVEVDWREIGQWKPTWVVLGCECDAVLWCTLLILLETSCLFNDQGSLPQVSGALHTINSFTLVSRILDSSWKSELLLLLLQHRLGHRHTVQSDQSLRYTTGGCWQTSQRVSSICGAIFILLWTTSPCCWLCMPFKCAIIESITMVYPYRAVVNICLVERSTRRANQYSRFLEQ